MSLSRKLLILATAAVALGAWLFSPAYPRPMPVFAADCSQGKTGTLIIQIVDSSTGSRVSFGTTEVMLKPDPSDFELDSIIGDSDVQDASALPDKDSRPGIIRIEGACSTTGSEAYTATIWSLPEDFADCGIVSGLDGTQLAAGTTEEMTLRVNCAGVGPTPVATATSVVGPAATVTTSASPLTVSCNGTSIVTVQVRDGAGNPVRAGTAVTVTSNLGTVSPASGQVTDNSGATFVFFTAPSSSGGTATIAATSGSASGTATVTVNCGTAATATVLPPPTTGTALITPPSTGNAGLLTTR